MRLATIRPENPTSTEERRDGRLIVVSSDYRRGAIVEDARCATMRRAIDSWNEVQPELLRCSDALERGPGVTSIDLSKVSFMAPLPRAADFVDGSSYLTHVERVRKARGAEPPEDLRTNPLMYRGIPTFLGATESIEVVDFKDGPDCEAELAVIVGDVPAAVSAAQAIKYALLITQINDISLRNRIKLELPKQFGFLNSKPPTVMGPFALTLDELGDSWNMGRPKLTMRVQKNGERLGELDTSELHFSFGELIAHAAMTHSLGAGTVVGTGTISNADESHGVACIAEQVALDMIAKREKVTPFFSENTEVYIETMRSGQAIFGSMRNRYVQAKRV